MHAGRLAGADGAENHHARVQAATRNGEPGRRFGAARLLAAMLFAEDEKRARRASRDPDRAAAAANVVDPPPRKTRDRRRQREHRQREKRRAEPERGVQVAEPLEQPRRCRVSSTARKTFVSREGIRPQADRPDDGGDGQIDRAAVGKSAFAWRL